MSLWYALGLTLSRLHRQEEAEDAFGHIVRSGRPDSEAVRGARQWLIDAGVLLDPNVAPPAPAPRRGTAAGATVKGRVTWGEPEPPREALIILQGLDTSAPRSHSRVTLGQVYEFEDLPAGSYRLVGGIGDQWLWDLKLTVEGGEELVVNLSKHNSQDSTAQL